MHVVGGKERWGERVPVRSHSRGRQGKHVQHKLLSCGRGLAQKGTAQSMTHVQALACSWRRKGHVEGHLRMPTATACHSRVGGLHHKLSAEADWAGKAELGRCRVGCCIVSSTGWGRLRCCCCAAGCCHVRHMPAALPVVGSGMGMQDERQWLVGVSTMGSRAGKLTLPILHMRVVGVGCASSCS
jgi:hypothetical protein